MPFDGSKSSTAIAVQGIERVIELLSSERQWCKGIRETRDGRRCLARALELANANEALVPVILSAIWQVTGRTYWQIEAFNDRADVTYADVRSVLLQTADEIRARQHS